MWWGGQLASVICTIVGSEVCLLPAMVFCHTQSYTNHMENNLKGHRGLLSSWDKAQTSQPLCLKKKKKKRISDLISPLLILQHPSAHVKPKVPKPMTDNKILKSGLPCKSAQVARVICFCFPCSGVPSTEFPFWISWSLQKHKVL